MTSLADLKSDKRNARRRTDRSATLIGESLKRYGAARSIVIDEDNTVLAGNGTLEQAQAAGISNVRIVEAAGDELIAVRRSNLSDADKVGLAIADNRTSDLSDWDAEMLRQLDAEYDLAPWFDEDELPIVEELPPEGQTDPDDVPEPPEDPVTRPGDLYALGNHRLLCGDATNVQHVERLMDGKKADMVFTDPPYGMNLDTDYSAIKGSVNAKLKNKVLGKSYAPVINDDQPYDPSFLLGCFNDVGEIFLWGADYYHLRLPDCGCFLVWDKSTDDADKMIGNGFEICWSKQAHKKTVARIFSRGAFGGTKDDRKVHPTQKPIKLVEWFFDRWGNSGDAVVDLYGGSGSTLIACEKTSRHCYMMEIDPTYCDVIVKRWEDYTGKKAGLLSNG